MMENNPHYVTIKEAEKMACPLSMKCETAHCCGGPKCMAWRWGTKYNYLEDEDRHEVAFSTTHGYCGMVRS